MLFQFGKFPVQLEGLNGCSQLLGDNWNAFSGDSNSVQQSLTLSLRVAKLPYITDSAEHWMYKESEDVIHAVYQDSGTPQFSLKYKKGSLRYIVSSEHVLPNNFRLGIHYALMTGLSKTCVGIHGVSVIVGDKLILLSAPSGTGKTTLAYLLNKYCDAAILNGDYALLSLGDDETVVFEPTPFCGSSGICHNHRLTLDRIVFLEQAQENIWKDLNPRKGYANLLKNSFLPEFDCEKRAQIMENGLKVIERIPTSSFAFAPNYEAAQLFQNNVAISYSNSYQ